MTDTTLPSALAERLEAARLALFAAKREAGDAWLSARLGLPLLQHGLTIPLEAVWSEHEHRIKHSWFSTHKARHHDGSEISDAARLAIEAIERREQSARALSDSLLSGSTGVVFSGPSRMVDIVVSVTQVDEITARMVFTLPKEPSRHAAIEFCFED